MAVERVRTKSGRASRPRWRRRAIQGFLGSLVQSLLHHVDDQHGRAFRFQPDQERLQSLRRLGPILDERGQRAIDARPEAGARSIR
jgi:hypothetical protein